MGLCVATKRTQIARQLGLLLFIAFLLLFAAGCGGGGVAAPPPPPPPQAPAQPAVTDYVYGAANSGSLSGFGINPEIGTLQRVDPSPLTTSAGLAALSRSGSGQFLYSISRPGTPDAQVTGHRVDFGSGRLSTAAAVNVPGATQLTVDPRNAFVVVFRNTGELATFNMGSGGGLTSAATVSAEGSGAARDLDFHPSGNLVFLMRGGASGTLAVYSYLIDRGTGALTFADSIPLNATEAHLAPDPLGDFVYTDGPGGIGVSVYRVNATTGGLAFVGTFGSGRGGELGANIRNNFLYRPVGNEVHGYRLDRSTGLLTHVGIATMNATGTSAWVERNGRFLYVGTTAGIAGFRFQDDGSLVPVPNSPFAAGHRVDRVIAVP